MTRREVVEKLLVESCGSNPRKVEKGSVRLSADTLDWTEIYQRGPVARTALVDWETFFRLVHEALA